MPDAAVLRQTKTYTIFGISLVSFFSRYVGYNAKQDRQITCDLIWISRKMVGLSAEGYIKI